MPRLVLEFRWAVRLRLPNSHPHEIFLAEPALRTDFRTIQLMRQQTCVVGLIPVPHIGWSNEEVSVVIRNWSNMARSRAGHFLLDQPLLQWSSVVQRVFPVGGVVKEFVSPIQNI